MYAKAVVPIGTTASRSESRTIRVGKQVRLIAIPHLVHFKRQLKLEPDLGIIQFNV